MQGRLAAGELHDLWRALRRDKAVEHESHLPVVQFEAIPRQVRAGIGEAEGAVEVAGRVDLDQSETGVLLVLGAEATVMGTSVLDLGLELQWQGSRLVVRRDVRVKLGVAEHQRLEPAVARAPL